MIFEIGKTYRHTTGKTMTIIGRLKSHFWGECLIGETDTADLVPVGEQEDNSVNWKEIKKGGREMTRQEVVEALIDMANMLCLNPDTPQSMALKMAIKALSQQTEDAISRADLQKQFQEKCVGECSRCEWDSPYWCVLIDNAQSVMSKQE